MQNRRCRPFDGYGLQACQIPSTHHNKGGNCFNIKTPLLLKEGRLRRRRRRGGLFKSERILTTPPARDARRHPSFKRRGVVLGYVLDLRDSPAKDRLLRLCSHTVMSSMIEY